MLQDEKLIPLSEAVKLVPIDPKPHSSALWRWMRKGVKGRNGHRVHLEHMRFGGRVVTSAEALERFGRALAEADREHFEAQADTRKPDPKPTRSEKRRGDAVKRAEKQLAAAGV